MPKTYYDSELTGEQIEQALEAIDGLITPSNNEKVLCIEDGKIVAKSASTWTGGYPEPTGTIPITANGTVNVKDYETAEVNVPSGITATDEGKVVKNGALVAQTARATAITVNGTYDTTENNSVTVNVSGGGDTFAFIVVTYPVGATCTATNGSITLTAPDTSGMAVFAVPTPSSTPETWTITATLDGLYSTVTVTISSYGASYEVTIAGILPIDYKEVEYLEVGSTVGPYIATGVSLSATAFFEIKAKYTAAPNNSTWLFGAWVSYKDTLLGYYNGNIRFLVGNAGSNVSFNTDVHTYSANSNGMYIDDVSIGNANWTNVPTNLTYHLFKIDGQNSPTNNARVYSCKIWNNGELVRNLIPCYRKSDNEPGMYDLISGVFYTNNGTGSFILGPEV